LQNCRTEEGLAGAAGDVVFGAGLGGAGEDGGGLVVFDEFAEPEEAGVGGDAGGLLHVVGDDDDGDGGAEVVDEFFDFGGGDGVEGGAGFVHEHDVGFGGEDAGDAEALLLTGGEGEG
jgi:hypothetical protein